MAESTDKVVEEEVNVDDALSVQASDLTTTVTGSIAETTDAKPQSWDSVQPLNTYQIKPPLQEKFKASPIKEIIRTVIDSALGGKTYTSEEAKTWTMDIANEINGQVRELKMKRYKHVVQVQLGELKGAGVKSGVRCIWDSECDGYTFDTFMNDTIFCVVAVFAVYLY